MSNKADTSTADRPVAKTSAGTVAAPVGSPAGSQNLPAAEVLA